MAQATTKIVNIVTFQDGSVVRYSDYYVASIWLDDISDNFNALNYLYQRCLNSPNPPIPSEASTKILKQHELLEENNEVHSVVRKIVLNCVKPEGSSFKITSISHRQLSQIALKTEKN